MGPPLSTVVDVIVAVGAARGAILLSLGVVWLAKRGKVY
jgi:hypothetical protein